MKRNISHRTDFREPSAGVRWQRKYDELALELSSEMHRRVEMNGNPPLQG